MKSAVSLMRALCLQHATERSNTLAESYLRNVALFQSTRHQYKTPKVYSKGVIINIQGYKEAYCADQKLTYGPNQCLIVTSNLPMECETFASPEKPIMGIFVKLDPELIAELVSALSLHHGQGYFTDVANNRIAVVEQDEEFQHTVQGLLSALRSPVEASILGSHYYKELHYRLLTGPERHLIATLCQQDHIFSRISQATEYIQNHYEQKLTVDDMAFQAGMSVSAFHRAFRETVEDSPLQYLKKIRLNQAKSLMQHQGLAANTAAFEVGYESAAQFSREFKRYFGLPPSKASQIGYQVMIS